MIVKRSRRTHVLLALVYFFCLLGTIVMARKDRETDAPTRAPTMTPSMAPTEEEKEKDKDKDKDKEDEPEAGEQEEVMSRNPTAWPTPEPTAEPTDYPTESPTDYPTRSPTLNPTQSPTMAPTDSPTAFPTAEPTQAPTESPVTEGADEPTGPTKKLVEVPIAPITMDIAADDGGSVSADTLQNDFETILNSEVLDRVYESFVHVDLELELRVADASATRRRLDEEGYKADIEGSAFFWEANETPTEQELSEFLFTYFSIYDSGDLTGRLADANPNITNVQIQTVDGKAVDIRSINQGGNQSSTGGDDSVNIAAIAGLVIGAVALFSALGAFIWLRRRDNGSVKGSVETEACDAPSPRATSPEISIDDDYSVGISSIGESIYTQSTDVNAFKNKTIAAGPIPVPPPVLPPPEGEYDADRLDKVIDSALDFSSRRDSLDSENVYDFSRKNSFEYANSEHSDCGDNPAPTIATPISF